MAKSTVSIVKARDDSTVPSTVGSEVHLDDLEGSLGRKAHQDTPIYENFEVSHGSTGEMIPTRSEFSPPSTGMMSKAMTFSA
jgi:hypothetical protein